MIVEDHKITINDTEDETEARSVAEWLKNIINAAD